MPERIKAVIFDLDGVIINSNPAIESFWKSWTDTENLPWSEAITRQWIHGRKAVDTVQGIFGHLPQARQQEIIDAAFMFDNTMQPEPVRGVVSFILALQALSIPTGVATSSHHSRMLKFLTGIGVDAAFTGFVTAHDVTQGKPHPEPYLAMSKKLNIDPASCLVFEDAISGLRSAKAAGMRTIGLGNNAAREILLTEGAAFVIPDFTPLTVNVSGIYLDEIIAFNF